MHGLMFLVAVALQDGVVGPDTPKVEERRSFPTPTPRMEPIPGPGQPARPKEDTVLRWNRVTLDAIRADKTPPPEAARNLALVHIAIHDAVLAIYRSHRPYKFEEKLTDPADPGACVAIAAHRVLVELYPKQVDRFDKVLDETMSAITHGRECKRGVELGADMAEKVFQLRREDGARRRVAAFRGSTEVGLWRPTLPKYAAGLLPQWTRVTPFGVRDISVYRPEAPPTLTSKEYTTDFNEVKRLGRVDSKDRLPDQTLIALFWNDGAGTSTPPGHWNLIARKVALQEGNSLPENARLFALLNIALADASIACWECKYRYQVWRPITAINLADRDGNPDTEPDTTWEPLLDTPPFPSYTSGHSTFSGAAATVLALFFGKDDIRFTVGSEGLPASERSYPGFWAAALEAGRSRIYGGIHYEFDNRAGLAVGRKLAEEIYRTQLRPDTTPGRTASRRP